MIVITFSGLLLCAATQHGETLTNYLSDYAETDRYRNLTITDRTGATIYAGAFDDSETVRRATFHVVGDKFGSVPSSALSQEAAKETNISALNGYKTVPSETQLNIDLRLQVGAYTLMANGDYRGAVVVLDYTTGEIITLVSTPSVDVLDPSNCNTDNAISVFRHNSGDHMKSCTFQQQQMQRGLCDSGTRRTLLSQNLGRRSARRVQQRKNREDAMSCGVAHPSTAVAAANPATPPNAARGWKSWTPVCARSTSPTNGRVRSMPST